MRTIILVVLALVAVLSFVSPQPTKMRIRRQVVRTVSTPMIAGPIVGSKGIISGKPIKPIVVTTSVKKTVTRTRVHDTRIPNGMKSA
ncbi:hypothetical protein AAVH_15806 [Aphelenchoides avenae]|nr:hypothetical protein AAVH_15806 [Aphelenchus avenae]